MSRFRTEHNLYGRESLCRRRKQPQSHHCVDHPTLEIVDDVLFNKVGKTLVAYMRRGESGYQIPEGIKEPGQQRTIEKRCAYKRPYSGRRNETKLRLPTAPLSEINIPAAGASIGRGAFLFPANLLRVSSFRRA